MTSNTGGKHHGSINSPHACTPYVPWYSDFAPLAYRLSKRAVKISRNKHNPTVSSIKHF